jgi:ABC transport system ATP-binding/permease protein
MRRERRKRRELEGKVVFDVNKAEQSGQLVLEAININHRYDSKYVIKGFNLRIQRGSRIGLIGPNGIGKSTLLNILLGKILPQNGKITLGSKLEIAYFDQLRQSLDLEKTVLENVAQGTDVIESNGKRRHVVSYLADFLFSKEQMFTRVKNLSGGECNRLLLARLFSLPSNVLVMDEPTNDLDLETLELLEELLSEYHGTLLLVSHDRAFLDNIVTSTLVFEGEGKVVEYIGGYSDWQWQIKNQADKNKTNKINQKAAGKKAKPEKIIQEDTKSTRKLSYNEQYELKNLPQQIEVMEAEKTELETMIAAADFYKQDATIIKETLGKFAKLESAITQAYERWEELERKK